MAPRFHQYRGILEASQLSVGEDGSNAVTGAPRNASSSSGVKAGAVGGGAEADADDTVAVAEEVL